MTRNEFISKLQRFCIECGFDIAGTCESEGIYGEITIRRIDEEPTWDSWEDNKFNFAGVTEEAAPVKELVESVSRALCEEVENRVSSLQAYKTLGFASREEFIEAAWPNYKPSAIVSGAIWIEAAAKEAEKWTVETRTPEDIAEAIRRLKPEGQDASR